MRLNKKFKIPFIIFWIITLSLSIGKVIFNFQDSWLTDVTGYVYVLFMVGLFFTMDYFNEKIKISERLIKHENTDIYGLLIITSLSVLVLMFIGFKTSLLLVLAIFSVTVSVWILIAYRDKITKKMVLYGLLLGAIAGIVSLKFIISRC